MGIDVISFPVGVKDVASDGDSVGFFFFFVGVNEDAHGGGVVVDAVEFAFFIGAIVPEAGPDLFDAFADVAFVRVVGEGVVESGSIEVCAVFGVSTGAEARGDVAGEGLLEFGEGDEHPFGEGAIFFDEVAEVLEHLFACDGVILEAGVGEHLGEGLVEPVVDHELVIEVVGDGVAFWGGAGEDAAEVGDVGGFASVAVTFGEGDVVERFDLGLGEVARRVAGFGGADAFEVAFDFFGSGESDFKSFGGDSVEDVLAEEGGDVWVSAGVGDEGVWGVVLLSLEVDVGEGGLGDFGNDAGDEGEVVGEGLEDDDVSCGEGFCAGGDDETAKGFLLVEGLVGGAAEEVFGVDGVDGGVVEELLVLVEEATLSFTGGVVGEAVNEGGVVGDEVVGEFDVFEADGVGGPEF